MRRILLSIKPVYAERILSGEKKYEYRKSVPTWLKDGPIEAYLYASSPVKRIVGVVVVDWYLSGTLDELWIGTAPWSGVCYDELARYLGDGGIYYAWHLNDPRRLDVDPFEAIPGFIPPHSFKYMPCKFRGGGVPGVY